MSIRWSAAVLLLIARAAFAVTAEPLDPLTLTPAELAQKLVGSGIVLSNVTYVGASSAAGTFVDGEDSVGFGTGIVLGSGRVVDIVGPNVLDESTTEFLLPGDADLDTAIPGFTTEDAAVLEFDFVPAGPEITFNYVFASDEYNEYANNEFNDVFAFYVNGVNLALLPDGVTPVSINNVNGGNPDFGTPAVNPAFYIDNDCTDGPCPIDFEADGRTVILTLKAPVNPGVTNHMKLAIADAGDAQVDSWVFIETGSLTLSEDCNNGIDDDNDDLIDNADPDCQVCGDGDLDPGEECDDGNVVSGDGCSPGCTVEPPTTTTTTSEVPTTSTSSTSSTSEIPTTSTSTTSSTIGTSSSTTSSTTTSTSSTASSSSTTSSTVANRPPECAGASASPSAISPPDHVLVDVKVVGLADPDGDPLTITTTGVSQDEPVDGTGDGSTCPDADGVGTNGVRVRAERSDSGDGRVYRVAFSADDGKGGTCTGSVRVCVPRDPNGSCGEGGPPVDATAPVQCPAVDASPVSPLGSDAVYPVTVDVPQSTAGTGNVKVVAQLFVDPTTQASIRTAAGNARTGIKVSKPVVRSFAPGQGSTLTLRLNGRGKRLLKHGDELPVQARVSVRRRGTEPTTFVFPIRWRR